MIALIGVNNIGFIGFKNKLLWHSSEDLKHFKNISLGKVMLCGFNTYQLLPDVVKKRGVYLDAKENSIIKE